MLKFLRIREIGKFINPKNIAVIGASEKEGKVGNTLMKKLLKFQGEIIPINTEKETIFEKKVYHSVLDYPKKIDLAIIAIPALHVKNVLEECGKKKIKNVIIISAGFSEVGNKELENEIAEIGKKYKINLVGPNCFGVANPYLDLDTTFSNLSAKKGNTAFISQSGALWSYIADISSSDEIGFSGFVSLGNMADLEFPDFIEYFNKDKKTKKIVLYIERLKDGRRFIDACKKSKKEIIVIKSGRTKTGSEATLSHTGSLATDYEIYKGAFKQARVKLESSFSSAFGIQPQKIEPEGKKIGIITNAGGAGALVTDKLVEKGYEVLAPIDVLGTALAEDYKKAFDDLKKKDIDSFVIILTPQSMSQPIELAKEIVKFSKTKPVMAVFLGEDSIQGAREILKKYKIPCITII